MSLLDQASTTELNPQISSSFCFTIEGNIGCGKSTFLSILKSRLPETVWIEEPVNQWQNLAGSDINILQKYYTEPNRWGFTFQTYAIYTRVKALKYALENHPNKLKISERSLLADKYVFSELMKDLGFMDECQYSVFRSLYDNFEQMIPIQKTKLIYLRCSPEKCHERTKIRQRQEENSIPLEYLQRIHEKHEKWFSEYDEGKVLILDTNKDFKEEEEKIKAMLLKVSQFINSN